MLKPGWVQFLLWAPVGVVLGLQVSVIGVLLLPVGLVVAALLIKFGRVWPEVLGLVAGIGATCLIVVALNADYWSCPESGETITRTPGGGEVIESCGDLSPWPWLIVGLILVAGATLAYRVAWLGCRGRCP